MTNNRVVCRIPENAVAQRGALSEKTRFTSIWKVRTFGVPSLCKRLSTFKLFVCVVGLFTTVSVLGDTATVGGRVWNYTVVNGSACVGNASSSAYPQAINTGTSGSISVPSELGGYIVTSIGDSAFYYCKNLTWVSIPATVTNIGDSAFYYCTGLKSVTIPESVTSIGEDAFFDCSALTSVTIPSGVTSIGDYAFYGCKKLTSVVMPDGVTSIGKYVFKNRRARN